MAFEEKLGGAFQFGVGAHVVDDFRHIAPIFGGEVLPEHAVDKAGVVLAFLHHVLPWRFAKETIVIC